MGLSLSTHPGRAPTTGLVFHSLWFLPCSPISELDKLKKLSHEIRNPGKQPKPPALYGSRQGPLGCLEQRRVSESQNLWGKGGEAEDGGPETLGVSRPSKRKGQPAGWKGGSREGRVDSFFFLDFGEVTNLDAY